MNNFNIALDGPAGAGKSTVARLVAKELGFVYVDTGSMYRAITWKVLKNDVPLTDERRIVDLAKATDIRLKPGQLGQQVFVDGVDVTDEIRTGSINQSVSLVARISEVRELLVQKQKELAADKGVVMDGRDIGTKVLPEAEVKVFLTASVKERAERRFQEMRDSSITLEQLEKDIALRDKLDREREASPLMQAADAVFLDTTSMPLDNVVAAILDLCRAKVSGGS